MKTFANCFFCMMVLCCLFSEAVADIVEAANFTEIETIFKDADERTLGIFDIDGVLTRSSEPAFQKESWLENQQFVKCLLKALTPQQRWLFSNLAMVQANLSPIDPNEWTFIKRIQERKIKLIAFTGSMTGLLNDIYLQDWYYCQLKRLNIDFFSSFPEMPSFCMNDLSSFMGRYPVFYKGVLFANGELTLKREGCHREEVLIEFFRRVDWRPKKVIFVDDHLGNLRAVEKALSLYDPDIEFTGVHFTFVPPPQYISSEDFQARWIRILSQVDECVNKSK